MSNTKKANWRIKVWQISSIHQIRQTKVPPNFVFYSKLPLFHFLSVRKALGMYRPLFVMLSSRKDPFQYVGVKLIIAKVM